MKILRLPKNYIGFIDDEDYKLIENYNWFVVHIKTKYYVQCKKRGKCIQLHSLITGYDLTDHKDGNGLNNCRSNLRAATFRQNAQNRIKTTKTKTSFVFKGVNLCSKTKRWRAYIINDRKFISLGYYDEEIEAARAYDEAAIKLFGEFANLNLR